MLAAMRAGVSGFIVKRSHLRTIFNGLELVFDGEAFLQKDMQAHFFEHVDAFFPVDRLFGGGRSARWLSARRSVQGSESFDEFWT